MLEELPFNISAFDGSVDTGQEQIPACVHACMALMLNISDKINAKMDLWFVVFKLSNTVNFSIEDTRGEQQPDE